MLGGFHQEGPEPAAVARHREHALLRPPGQGKHRSGGGPGIEDVDDLGGLGDHGRRRGRRARRVDYDPEGILAREIGIREGIGAGGLHAGSADPEIALPVGIAHPEFRDMELDGSRYREGHPVIGQGGHPIPGPAHVHEEAVARHGVVNLDGFPDEWTRPLLGHDKGAKRQ